MCNPGSVPEYVEYRSCAVQRRTIDGVVPLASLSRVVSAVHGLPAKDAHAQLQLEFAEDAQRRVRVSGQIVARVVLQCQSCATPFEHVIDASIAGVIVADDVGAAGVPKADEPIMADGETLDVRTLAEDELLLSLPIVARCGTADCKARYNEGTTIADSDEPELRQREDNPFSVLEKMKHD